MLRNQIQVSADIKDIPVNFKEIIYNNKPILEVEIDTLSGPKNFTVEFKQVFKHAEV